jgi:pimeloyl-ACP methyl ester carboxylesterase
MKRYLRKGLRILVVGALGFFFSFLVLLLLVNSMGWLTFRKPNEEMLEAMPGNYENVSSRIDTLSLEGWSVCYSAVERTGTRRPAVVFVHGTPGSMDNFLIYLQNKKLSASADLYSLDRPGFGQSDFGRPLPRLEDQARILHRLVKEVSGEPVLLVGHSLGCSIIGRYAMDYPGEAAGLLMVSAPIDPELEPPNGWRKIMRWSVFHPFIPTSFWVSNEELVVLEEELKAIEDRWGEIDVPVVFMHGTDDMLVPVENMTFARQKLGQNPALKLYVIPNGSHFVIWSDPDRVSRHILELLDQAKLPTQ